MFDAGISHVIVKRLNRWYRSRSQPHGTVDVTHRGTRLTYNSAYRFVNCLNSSIFLMVACAMFFMPMHLASETPIHRVILYFAWALMWILGTLTPLEVFRTFVVVNDEGLLKSNLFGKQSRLEWREISQVRINDNSVSFLNESGKKLEVSLCNNGWQDFAEISARYLKQNQQRQIASAVAQIGPKQLLRQYSEAKRR